MVLQTDVAYFTAPAGETPRAPLPPRPPKPTPIVSPVIPLDLARPRDLVATLNRGPSLESASQKDKLDDQPSGNTHRDATDKQEPLADYKRPPMGHNLAHASTSSDEKARAPPTKRPKKDKANIFIPKKPNKVRLLRSLFPCI